MYEFSLASALGHPLGQLVMTVIVAAVTSVLTVRIMAATAGTAKSAPQAPAPAPMAAPRDDTAIVAAISAAVYAVIGAHRIVYLAEARHGSAWTSEIRSRHHTSHTPHH